MASRSRRHQISSAAGLSPPGGKPTFPPGFVRSQVNRLSWGLMVVTAIGMIMGCTVRDRWPGLDSLYYALPAPVLGGLLVAAGLLSLGRTNHRRCGACLSVATALLSFWVVENFVDYPCRRTVSGLRILLWNVGRGRGGWKGIISQIQNVDADIIGLVEARTEDQDPERFWSTSFPAYMVSAPGRGMVVLVRGEIQGARLYEFGERSRCALVEMKVNGDSLRLVLADLEANPLSRRRPLLERLEDIAQRRPAAGTILMGDFNTPGDSVWFNTIRRDYANLYEEAGTGMLPTWPYRAPVLAIDHIWVSRHFAPTCARKKTSWLSDHAQVWGEVHWSKRAPPVDGSHGRPPSTVQTQGAGPEDCRLFRSGACG